MDVRTVSIPLRRWPLSDGPHFPEPSTDRWVAGFQSPYGDGRFLTWRSWGKDPAVGYRSFQSPYGDGRFLTPTVGYRSVLLCQACFNPLTEMAAF